jgi:hypothetical protein
MDLSLQQVALILGGWLLIAILGEPLQELLRSLNRLLAGLFGSIAEGLGSAIVALRGAIAPLQGYARGFWAGVELLLERIVAALSSATEALQRHAEQALNVLPASSRPRGLQVFGYLLYLAAFAAFAFADVAQATNSRSVMYVSLEVPAFLQDLTIPLLIASGGTAIMLGTILGDFLAKTEIVPWLTLPRWARGITLALAMATFAFTLILMLLIALVRVPELVRGLLSPAVAQQLHVFAAFADSLVIIPLLITTLMLFWGMFGLVVVYFVVVGAFSLLLRLLTFLLGLLESAAPLLGSASAALVNIIFSLLCVALSALAWLFRTICIVLDHCFDLLARALDLLVYPLAQPARSVRRYFREGDAQ